MDSFAHTPPGDSAEELLRESENRYRAIVESQKDAVCRWRPDTTLTFANRFYRELFGLSEDSIGHTRWITLTPEEERPVVMAHVRSMLENKAQSSYEHSIVQADGSFRWYLWVDVPLLDEHGECHEIQSVGRDITERIRTERTLRRLVEQVGPATGAHFISVLVRHLCATLEVDVAFIGEKRGSEGVVGEVHSIKDGVGQTRSVSLKAPPRASTLNDTSVEASICEDCICGGEFATMINGKGQCVSVPVLDADNNVVGIVGVGRAKPSRDADFLRDMLQLFSFRIAAEFERERHARESSDFTRELERRVEQRTEQIQLQAIAMDSTMEGMAVLKNERYVYTNQSHTAMFGYAPEELIGQNWRLHYPPEQLFRFEQEILPDLKRAGRWRGESRGLRKDGSVFDVEISLVYAPGGQLISNSRDITVAKMFERELIRKSAELERATRMKDEFLASMSHELRTPLAGILGLAEVLRENIYGELKPQQSEAIRAIEDSGRHLLDLINDILDLSKIESGRVELEWQPVTLEEICRSGIRMVKSAASKKNIAVSLEVKPPDLVAQVDPRRFKQILINLLDNAIKFTPAGGQVDLRVHLSTIRKDVVVRVSDTGCGIDPANFRRIFLPFEQVDRHLAREYEGAGLGLPLVLRLAELHGGGVAVSSELGKGSSFTVTIPWRAPDAETDADKAEVIPQPPANLEAAGQSTSKVLIIEDNRVTGRILHDYLVSRGYDCLTVQESPKALTQGLAYAPDVILMDIQMPVIDGFDLAREIRTCGNYLLENVPIIALTALAMPGDRERCLQSGMNDYLAKPFRLAEVHETIVRHLRSGRENSA